ncbi:ABC transporter substrate-binding protein [Sphingomonas sp. G-3-2-10]|uniref:ABC transporter substrate-binding protein n=1 Tax=Sphingomonas sp. G-3-2-10 TaxID=2728838 RepID=UPI00146DE183|nr:ABC transporter substrate-binding protein [Sphingomonas sp. G-3-2-10]NML08344.1 ABC transporter substrate-binding protein [Sphingomonas sp. G-3-2-10]
MNMLRRSFIALALCVVVAGCKPSEPAATQSATPFKVAFNTWLGYSPLIIAKEKGFLKKRGLDVDVTFIEGIGEKNAALLRGDIDGVGHTADSAVTSAAAGVDGQIVYVFDESYGADGVLASQDIKSISDLRGKRIALEPGFTGHFFVLSLLEEAGLGPKDVNIVAMETGNAGSAFLARKVDAAATWEPWISKAKERPDGKILVTSRDRPGRIIDVLFMNRKTIEARPADIRKLVEAMDEATAWYRTHQAEGDQIIARFWKLPIDEAKATVAGVRFFDRSQNAAFFGTSAAPGQLAKTVESANRLWARSGVIKAPVPDPRRLVYYGGVSN